MDVKSFFAALLGDWTALMGGIVSILFTVFGFWANTQQQKRVFWAIALVCFFLAAARIWTIEHQARLGAERRLEELTKPDLLADIPQITTGRDGERNMLLLTVEMRNRGADSAVLGYRLLVGGQRKPLAEISDGMTIWDAQGKATRVFNRRDALHEITATPIRKGEVKYGVLLFAFSDQERLAQGTELILRFEDYTKREYKTRLLYEVGNDKFMGFPGLGGPPPAKKP